MATGNSNQVWPSQDPSFPGASSTAISVNNPSTFAGSEGYAADGSDRTAKQSFRHLPPDSPYGPAAYYGTAPSAPRVPPTVNIPSSTNSMHNFEMKPVSPSQWTAPNSYATDGPRGPPIITSSAMPKPQIPNINSTSKAGMMGGAAATSVGAADAVSLSSLPPLQLTPSDEVYAYHASNTREGVGFGGLLQAPYSGSSTSSMGHSNGSGGSNSIVYRKLAPPPSTNFGKDKVAGRSILETLVYRYHRRLTRASRSLLLTLIVIGFALTLTLIYLCSTGFGVPIILGSFVVAAAGITFSMWLLAWILKFDEGPPEMREVATAIHEGSEGFFHVQYGTITKISLGFATVLFVLYWFRDTTVLASSSDGTSASKSHPAAAFSSFGLAFMTSGTFLLGAFCSALAGYSGMWVSVRTNVRVAAAARRCYNEALQLCFRGGAFSSIINVALAVGGIAISSLSLLLFWPSVSYTQLPLLLVGFGFGASLVAMFAQLGGGIYTKAADVGADLVGKIEAGIPEDDPRNPAVIADLVGDNVGDCAGQCADVFESISAEIISAMILGGALAQQASLLPSEAAGYVLFPLGVHSMDLLLSSLGVLLVRTKPGLPDADSASGGPQDPLTVMVRVYFFTCLLGTLGFGGLCRLFLFTASQPRAWMYYWACGVIGMVCAFLFILITQYYTDYEYTKVRRIAEASMTGPATNIIAGLSVGLESTALPVLLIAICVLVAYYCGEATLLIPSDRKMAGLFGTAVATMGMLSTAAFVLTMSSFGPIADNAGGIVEMSRQDDHVRAITDRLDAVGNVTKANTKGFSVGTAALACFLLFAAFLDEITLYSASVIEGVDLSTPEVFIAGLLGAALVFLFCAWAMEAVGRAAQQVVQEVRRQFAEFPGIMDFTERPDYHACVAIVSRSALREMIRPGLLAVLSPVIVGLLMRCVGSFRNMPHLAAQAVASFLMFSTAAGILMALFLNNAGGAWDNAKKYIETGAFGGKGSKSHKAAVVGDTVGDPSKDTAGPSVHVLIKLVSTVTIVLAPLFASPSA